MTSKIRVGILSPFYNNFNYGGKLQAYALTRYLNQNGFDAVQIQYGQPNRQKKASFTGRIRRVLLSSDYRHAVLQTVFGLCLPDARENMETRKAAFTRFDKEIPHTAEVYDDSNIGETVHQFDAFICGSDQIWNPGLTKRAYYLDFVPDGKRKFSYAASIAGGISDEWKQVYSRMLVRLDEISVREEKSRSLLQDMLGKEICLTVDPTLLLSREEWESVAAAGAEREPYLFCYFLGYSGKMRTVAASIAQKRGLKVVTIPHLLGTAHRFYPCDADFGQEKLYDVSPDQFLALIRNAAYVITDSFHAAVLSLVFQKQFVVFGRTNHPEMSSRIEDLLRMYDLEDRFCRNISEKQAEQIIARQIQYRDTYEELEERRTSSEAFLKRNLENLV